MSLYVPFLKLKQNEISATALVVKGLGDQLTPFFDIPRPQEVSEKAIIKRLMLGRECIDKHLPDTEFYIDNFDLDDSIKLGAQDQYAFILDMFADRPIIPVVGLHREDTHNSWAISCAMSRKKIAVRLLPQDIESYLLTRLSLQNLWDDLLTVEDVEIHLILDFRVINGVPADIASLAHAFINSFKSEFAADKYVVTSSSISPFIRDIVGTKGQANLARKEWLLWETLSGLDAKSTAIAFGDYCTVSPDYTDMELESWMMQSVATPKVFYTYKDMYFVCRGGAFKTHVDGYKQYFTIADTIVKQAFFRKNYSYGEKYIYERCSSSPRLPKTGGSPSSWLKATLVSHMTYTCNNL